MPIIAGGIGSGLDVSGLVTKLVAAEGQPASNRLDRKEATLQADLSAYGTLKSALSSFKDSVADLADKTDYQGRTAVSSDKERFTASADDTAVPGSYDLEVFQLAQSAKMRSGDGEFTSATNVVGTGTLDLSLGVNSFQLTIDATNSSLEGIRDAINDAEDNPGITASVISVDGGTQLVFSSTKLGAANTIDIVATDDDGADGFDLARIATASLDTIHEPQDAIIYVDQQIATRDSNSFSDVIQGVSFTIEKAEEGKTETLTIDLDKASVKTKVESFVSAYNELVETMGTLSSYSEDNGASGALFGDTVLRGVKSQIRQQMTSAISGLEFGTLAEIGVTTKENGELELDSSKFDGVLSTDFTAVSKLFASENGLANSLEDILKGFVDSGGILTSRTEGLQNRISSIGDDREKLGIRLAALEKRYNAQFNAMDLLVGQLKSTGDYLASQLANLPKPNSIRR